MRLGNSRAYRYSVKSCTCNLCMGYRQTDSQGRWTGGHGIYCKGRGQGNSRGTLLMARVQSPSVTDSSTFLLKTTAGNSHREETHRKTGAVLYFRTKNGKKEQEIAFTVRTLQLVYNNKRGIKFQSAAVRLLTY